MELIGITRRGRPAAVIAGLPEIANHVLESTATMYRGGGYMPPWIGYLAIIDHNCVGTCAFKSPPRDNRVEIAYFTFPGYEGRGIATRMAAYLIGIARSHMPAVVITAQTLPVENASNAILKKLGFRLAGETDHPVDGRVWEWTLSPA
jgi:[ribosomal protein S5]-alanine N-acetyltransferase